VNFNKVVVTVGGKVTKLRSVLIFDQFLTVVKGFLKYKRHT